jgi:hypothetical protein
MAKKEENKELVAQANSAMTIAQEIRAVVDSIIEAGGECSDDTFAALQVWNAALEVKAENIGFVKIQLEKEAEYFQAVEDAAKARRKARESAVERLKNYLRDCMIAADVKSIKKGDGLFSFSLTDGRSRCVVDNADELPFEFTQIETLVKPKSDEIKKALEEGKEIPGAHLEYGSPYVTIRGGK